MYRKVHLTISFLFQHAKNQEASMKDECHHLKHVQKRVLRSARRKTVDKEKSSGFSSSGSESRRLSQQVEVYDEVIPSDQQVLRAPTRNTYH